MPATVSQKPGEVDSPSITADTNPSDDVRIASSASGSINGPTPASRTAIGPSHAHNSPLAKWRSQRSPDPLQMDLMRTYNASQWQVFWKLRVPASIPFLFTSLKVAIAISLVGAIVGELPTGAEGGLGSRMLAGSYYGQMVQIWSCLVLASILGMIMVYTIAGVEWATLRRTGARA